LAHPVQPADAASSRRIGRARLRFDKGDLAMRRRHTLFLATLLTTSALAGFQTGCAPERHEVIPATAMLGAEGEKRLTYTTNGPGTLYVYDQTANRLVYSGDVDGTRQISLDPEKNELTVDGTLVQNKTLTRGHNHRIFFQPKFR
jgi:hypothetical protein